MNSAEKHYKGLKLKTSKQKSKSHTKSSLLKAQHHHMAGRFSQAEAIYSEVLEYEPHNPDALHLLGVIKHRQGNVECAVDLISRALEAEPNFPEALNNLGNAFIDLNKFQEAVDSYNLSLDINPKYQLAKDNLCRALYEFGNYLHKLGNHAAATENYKKALTIKPNYAKASYNLGVALGALGKLKEAAKSYIESLANDPSQPEPHNNLGNVLFKLERYNEAVDNYLKALSLKPDFAEAHFNLGLAYREMGLLLNARGSYYHALNIKPNYDEVWNNLKYVTKALQSESEDDLHKLGDCARATSDFAFHQFYIEGFKPHKADESLKKAISSMPDKRNQTIAINNIKNLQSYTAKLPKNVVALLHFGRSGTGLLHSLIDNHPEISTLPSIFLSGYFNKGVWERLTFDGWKGLPRNFVNEFAVLFDSRDSKSVPSRFGEDHSNIGKKEGMTALGKNRNEHLYVDTEKFCAIAKNIMKEMDKINPISFLLVAHVAYEKVIKLEEEHLNNKHLCFYHIHNPDHYAQANFLRYTKDARILMMVREPLENCQSWIRGFVDQNNYEQCIFRILTLLFDIDQVFFRKTESVGVRLEDLKYRHEDTLKALCNWLGIKFCPTLYEMTAQGKKWWGDPSSPNYSKDSAMSAFSEKKAQDTTISILSDSDQFILRTLFNPFSVRFGYLRSNKKKFESDLNEIKPLIGCMMDFEREMLQKLNETPNQFRNREAYKIFHAGLLDRWQVLDEYGHYPHMLEPLVI